MLVNEEMGGFIAMKEKESKPVKLICINCCKVFTANSMNRPFLCEKCGEDVCKHGEECDWKDEE